LATLEQALMTQCVNWVLDLDMLQQVRPALEQFYQALNPQQQEIVNRTFRHG
jgi:hypothetical protein